MIRDRCGTQARFMQAFILSDHESMGSRVRQVLLFEGLDCQAAQVIPLEHAGDRLANGRPDLLVVVLSPDPERALLVMGEVLRRRQSRVLVVGPSSSKLVLRALRGGAVDYVDEIDLEAELQVAVRRQNEEKSGQAGSGRLIAVLAPSGGSGSSTLSANVAAVLAKEHKEVALIDLKLEAGDLAALLDLKPAFTLADLTQNVARMDRVLLERSLIRHSSGVHLLAPPRTFVDAASVTPEGVDQALNLARAVFPYVVVDLDQGFSNVQVVAIQQADVILLVTKLEFTSLRNSRRAIDHLEHLDIDRSRIRLVVNRYGQPKEVPTAKAEEALGVKIFHFVPNDPRAVIRANNNGVPFVLETPSAKVSRNVTRLALSINGAHKGHGVIGA
jgi:pilus assembly protein CpaE